MMILTLIAVIFIGCAGEDTEEEALERSATGMLGATKMPEEAVAMAPPAPGVPFVKAVGFYKDWQFAKPLTGAAAVGETIFIKIVFSEAMQVVVADDKTARPILFRQIDSEMTRFHVVRHNTKLGDGDAKHRGKDAATFVCKYTVQPEDEGSFGIAVGKQSTDTDGVRMAAFYRHKEKVLIKEPDTTPPTVVSVTHYADADRTDLINDVVHPGEDIYTKIVFSEMMHIRRKGKQSFPVLYYRIGREQTRYHIVAGALQDGTAVTEDDSTFICRNTIPVDAVGNFWITVGKASKDSSGNAMAGSYAHDRVRVERKHTEPDPGMTAEPTLSEPRKKAEEIVSRIIFLANENIVDGIPQEIEPLEQETGLSHRFVTGTLISMYFEEFPEEREKPISWYEPVLEYLRLSFTYPNASEEELLRHYRQSVKDGRVTTDIKKSPFIQKWRAEQERVQEAAKDLSQGYARAWRREVEAVNKKRAGLQIDLTAERERILMEEYGAEATLTLANKLLEIYLDLHPDNGKRVAAEEFIYSGMVRSFLVAKKGFPEKSEQELLTRFREQAKLNKYFKGSVVIPKWLLDRAGPIPLEGPLPPK